MLLFQRITEVIIAQFCEVIQILYVLKQKAHKALGICEVFSVHLVITTFSAFSSSAVM